MEKIKVFLKLTVLFTRVGVDLMFPGDLYFLCVDKYIMIFSHYISYMYAIITFMHGVTNTRKA